MKRLFAALLLVATPALGDEVDPRALFTEKKFAAAGAGFEKRWNMTGDASEGLNAAIAFRAAGSYAHARVVLSRVRKSNLRDDIALRAKLLDEKLEQLTATVKIAESDVLVEANGEAIERIGASWIVEVGKLDLTLNKEGCDPFHWKGEALPGQEIKLAPKLVCPRGPGSLHLSLGFTRGAEVELDGARSTMAYEANYSLRAGTHRLSVWRNGIPLVANESVTVDSGRITARNITVPVRAREGAFLIGATGATFSGNAGTVAGVGGLFGMTGALEFTMGIGAATNTIDPRGGAGLFIAVGFGAPHVLSPAVAKRTLGGTFFFEWMPTMLQLNLGQVGSREEGRTLFIEAGVAPFRVSMAYGSLTAELSLLPIGMRFVGMTEPGFSRYRDTRFSYAGGAVLTMHYGFLDF